MLRTYAAPGVHVHDPDGEPAAARPGARTRAPGRLPWAHPVVVVLVALPVLGSTAVADVGGPYRYALLIALVAPLVFVVRDLRSASPSPARDQRPWTVSVRCALVGAVAGLVAGNWESLPVHSGQAHTTRPAGPFNRQNSLEVAYRRAPVGIALVNMSSKHEGLR